jgi:hypothetical protein
MIAKAQGPFGSDAFSSCFLSSPVGSLEAKSAASNLDLGVVDRGAGS